MTQNIELPDGTLMTIEGGDAANTARLIAERVGGRHSTPTNHSRNRSNPEMLMNVLVTHPGSGHAEPPLPLPMFRKAQEEEVPQPVAHASRGAEPPLRVVHNFFGGDKSSEAVVVGPGWIEPPLSLPSLNSRKQS